MTFRHSIAWFTAISSLVSVAFAQPEGSSESEPERPDAVVGENGAPSGDVAGASDRDAAGVASASDVVSENGTPSPAVPSPVKGDSETTGAAPADPAPPKNQEMKADSTASTEKQPGAKKPPFVEVHGYAQPTLRLFFDDAQDDSGFGSDFYIRRVRLLFSGKVHPKIGFFIGTLTGDLGKAGDDRPATIIGDAWIEGEVARELKINAGLLKLPFSRHGAQGGSSLHGIDFHGSFLRRAGPKPLVLEDGTTQARPSVPHRDYGVMARGLVLNDRLDYRLAVTDGVSPHEADEANPRFVGRIGVNAFDPEPEFFWKGTHVGQRKVLTFGFSFDVEPSVTPDDELYYALALDAFADIPIGQDGVVGTFSGYHFGEGGAVPEGTGFWADFGYRIRKVEPLVAMELYLPSDGGEEDQGRREAYFGGVNWWIQGHSANLKAQFGGVKVNNADQFSQELLVQGQVKF